MGKTTEVIGLSGSNPYNNNPQYKEINQLRTYTAAQGIKYQVITYRENHTSFKRVLSKIFSLKFARLFFTDQSAYWRKLFAGRKIEVYLQEKGRREQSPKQPQKSETAQEKPAQAIPQPAAQAPLPLPAAVIPPALPKFTLSDHLRDKAKEQAISQLKIVKKKKNHPNESPYAIDNSIRMGNGNVYSGNYYQNTVTIDGRIVSRNSNFPSSNLPQTKGKRKKVVF